MRAAPQDLTPLWSSISINSTKPRILKNLFSGRSIPGIQIHDTKEEILVVLRKLFINGQMEWSKCFRRAFLVDDGENFELFVIHEALIRGWKWTKDPIVLQIDFRAKFVVICRNVRLEDVKAVPKDQANKLWQHMVSIFHLYGYFKSYRGAK